MGKEMSIQLIKG
jgi:hypothetical protein